MHSHWQTKCCRRMVEAFTVTGPACMTFRDQGEAWILVHGCANELDKRLVKWP